MPPIRNRNMVTTAVTTIALHFCSGPFSWESILLNHKIKSLVPQLIGKVNCSTFCIQTVTVEIVKLDTLPCTVLTLRSIIWFWYVREMANYLKPEYLGDRKCGRHKSQEMQASCFRHTICSESAGYISSHLESNSYWYISTLYLSLQSISNLVLTNDQVFQTYDT